MKFYFRDITLGASEMAEHSSIKWTNHSFTPWFGCSPVSPGCDHCYAAGCPG